MVNLFLDFDGKPAPVLYPQFLEQSRLYINYDFIFTVYGFTGLILYIIILNPVIFVMLYLLFADDIFRGMHMLDAYYYMWATLLLASFRVARYYTSHYINALWLCIGFPFTFVDFYLEPEPYSLEFLQDPKYTLIETVDMDIK